MQTEYIDDKSRQAFSSNLREIMSKTGKSQSELSENIGVSTATVSDWCNGKKYPRPSKMQKIAEYLGVTMQSLMEDISNSDGGVVRLDADEMDFLREIRTRPEMKIMFSAAKNATKEDLIKAVKIVEALRDAEEGKGK